MLQQLALASIRPPSFKLRADVGDIEDLKASLKEKGLLQAIIVRKVGNHWEVVAGHRRYLSAIEIGWTEIDTVVIEADDKSAYEFALLENIQRKSMDPLEEAVAFHAYVHRYGYGSALELATKIGKSQSYISNRLSVVDTSDEIKALVREKKLSMTDATELSRARTEESEKLANLASDIGLDSKQIRSAVTLVNQGYDAELAAKTVLQYENWDLSKQHEVFNLPKVCREQVVLSLEKCLKEIDEDITRMADGEEKAIWTREIRYQVHVLTDSAMKLRKRFDKP